MPSPRAARPASSRSLPRRNCGGSVQILASSALLGVSTARRGSDFARPSRWRRNLVCPTLRLCCRILACAASRWKRGPADAAFAILEPSLVESAAAELADLIVILTPPPRPPDAFGVSS